MAGDVDADGDADALKEMKMQKKQRVVVIELPLPDGWMSMYIGRFVRIKDGRITLKDPCFVKDTGRRHLFFAGSPDGNAEWEPSGSRASFPAAGVVITEWDHDFEQFLVAK